MYSSTWGGEEIYICNLPVQFTVETVVCPTDNGDIVCPTEVGDIVCSTKSDAVKMSIASLP